VEQLPKRTFINAWCSVAYLFPGLHPDGFDDPDSGWPPGLRRFAMCGPLDMDAPEPAITIMMPDED
jgi:hypothetical protein